MLAEMCSAMFGSDISNGPMVKRKENQGRSGFQSQCHTRKGLNVRAQREQILKHLKDGRAITPLEALGLYGTNRLAARICELRGQGEDIRTEMIEANGKRFAAYKLCA